VSELGGMPMVIKKGTKAIKHQMLLQPQPKSQNNETIGQEWQ
jgi:hypothetical protein